MFELNYAASDREDVLINNNKTVELQAGDKIKIAAIKIQDEINNPPVINPFEDLFVKIGTPINIVAEVFDPDEDVLSFNWSELTNTGVAFTSTNNQLSLIAPNSEGELEFKLLVSDGKASTSEILRIVVEQNNPVDEYSWTDITPKPGAKVVYVSASGNDSNDGTENSPLRSLTAAYNIVGNANDQILLERGGSYSSDLDFRKNGLILSSYGNGARPKIVGTLRFVGPSAGSNCIIKGIDFRPLVKYEGNAIRAVTDNFDNVIIEDCLFIHHKEPVLIQGDTANFTIDNVKIRRCIFFENGDKSPIDASLNTPDRKNKRSSGMFISRAKNFVIEDSIIAYCGFTSYDPQVRSQYNPDLGYRANASIYSHGIYNQFTTFNDSIQRGCVFIECASHGLQCRAGGLIENNVFYRCPIGFLLGNEWSNTGETDQPIIGTVRNNMIFDGVDLNHNEKRAWVGELQQCQEVEFVGNIVVNDTTGSNPRGLMFGSSKINNSVYTIKDNIVNWTSPFLLVGRVANLVFENNKYYDAWGNTETTNVNGIRIPKSAGQWQNSDVKPVINNVVSAGNSPVNTRLPSINEVIPDFERKILSQIEDGWNVNLHPTQLYAQYKGFISGN